MHARAAYGFAILPLVIGCQDQPTTGPREMAPAI